MPKIPLLSDELDAAANLLELYGKRNETAQFTGRYERIDTWPRAVNILRAKAAALRAKGKPKPQRKTVVGYVGSRHTKIKVQGLFEEENKDE